MRIQALHHTSLPASYTIHQDAEAMDMLINALVTSTAKPSLQLPWTHEFPRSQPWPSWVQQAVWALRLPMAGSMNWGNPAKPAANFLEVNYHLRYMKICSGIAQSVRFTVHISVEWGMRRSICNNPWFNMFNFCCSKTSMPIVSWAFQRPKKKPVSQILACRLLFRRAKDQQNLKHTFSMKTRPKANPKLAFARNLHLPLMGLEKLKNLGFRWLDLPWIIPISQGYWQLTKRRAGANPRRWRDARCSHGQHAPYKGLSTSVDHFRISIRPKKYLQYCCCKDWSCRKLKTEPKSS